ncbi:hypothetical protein MXD81_20705, partial [Microbacteriaceae bacterium K1510]|nr:hypothetical protein [Microbacteriaceae bacterium K1510]
HKDIGMVSRVNPPALQTIAAGVSLHFRTKQRFCDMQGDSLFARPPRPCIKIRMGQTIMPQAA